ncbi:MAG: hypothetical protein KF782_26665 [Labilithrix sp.]|nr:hypothetical protein [Labilithrix sp.]
MSILRSCSAALTAGIVAAAAGGCSSGPEDVAAASSSTCASRAATAPRDVSFARDVLPLFQTSCAFGSCHGAPGRNGVYLGGRGSDASAIRAELLETSARASMPFVTPGEPDRSWLLRKLDGDFCGVTCSGGACGERMPKGGDPLSAPARDAIAAWIASGAPDN